MKSFIGTVILIIAILSFGAQAGPACPPISERKPVPHIWNQDRVDTNGLYFPLIDKKSGFLLEKAFNVSTEYYSQLACPRATVEDGFDKQTIFDQVMTFKCVDDGQDLFKNVTNPWYSNCTHADTSNDGGVNKFTRWVVLTDHVSYGLSLGCVDDQLYSWIVFSTLPVLTKDKLKLILNELKKNGFDTTQVLPIHYGFCENCKCPKP